MLRPRLSSPAGAKPKQRARLAARWFLPVFLIAVALSLIGLFPREAKTRQQALEQSNDIVATEYLRGVLQQHPDDIEVRTELVQRAIRAGDEQTAITLLALWRNASSAQQGRAIMLTADILELQLKNAAPDSPRHAEILARMRETLEHALAILGDPNIDQQWLTAKLRLYSPDRSGAYYLKMAAHEPGRAPYWLEQAARAALANGQYRQSAEAYFAAQQASRDPEHRKHYFLEGLRTLQSGNLLNEALAAAARYESPYLADREVLFYLIKLARAANRNDIAERYARKLLQMALLESLPSLRQAAWQGYGPQPTITGPVRLLRIAGTPKLPFDDEAYTVAYDVFIGNRKFDDALAVAVTALKQVPERADWIKRLAQVAEWAGLPEQALSAWRQLALGSNDPLGWQGMARLAPSLLADEDLLLLWQREIARRSLEDKEWREVQAAYERLARPLDGAAYFEKRFATEKRAQLLEQAAYLRQSMGDIDGALADYRQLAISFGPRPDWAQNEASLHYSRGELQQAFDALNAAKPAASVQDSAFWKVLGDLAWNLGQSDVARSAYVQRQDAADWQNIDTDRLLALFDPTRVEERFTVSRAAWRHSRNFSYFDIAFNILLDRGQLAAAASMLAELTPQERLSATDNPNFLVQRSRYYWLAHDSVKARADLVQAHRLSPSPELKTSLIWLLIDIHDSMTLSELLPQWENVVAGNTQLAESIAAGWRVLGNTQRALFWSRQLLSEHEKDPAWLTDYADLLEQSGQTDMAWRIKHHAWLMLRTRPVGDSATLQRQLRLALMFEPVDSAENHLIRSLLASNGPLPSSATPVRDAAVIDDLAYAWFLSQDDDSRARYWYWRRYVKKRSESAARTADYGVAVPDGTPGKAGLNLQLADQLQENPSLDTSLRGESLHAASARADRNAEQALLERDSPIIQSADHSVAALDGAPGNDTLHQQLVDQLLAHRPAGIRLRSEYRSADLRGWQHTLTDEVAVTPQLRAGVTLYRAENNWDAVDYSQNTRSAEMKLSALHGDDQRLIFSAGKHLGWKDYTSVALRSEGRYDRWLFAGETDWNRPTDDSAALTMGGMQRQLVIEGGYRIGSGMQTRAALSRALLFSQDNAQLGGRNQADLALHWESSRRGGISAELLAQRTLYTPHNNAMLPFSPGTPLPQSYGRVGLTMGYGMVYQDGYTRAWQPFGSSTIGYHNVNGFEAGWLLGFAGSLFGNDHLSIYGGRSLNRSGGGGISGGIFYQWLY